MEPAASDEAPVATKSPKRVSIALPQRGDTIGATPSVINQNDDASLVDAVAWPINRYCYEELTSSELATVEQLFVGRDDTPSFLKWIVLHKPPQRFAKRLLVISSFRVGLYKRRQTPFARSLILAKEFALLHLDAICVRRLTTLQPSDPTAVATSITMRFRAPAHHHKRESEEGPSPHDRPTFSHNSNLAIHFDPGIHAETIVRLCQRKLHTMRLVFPGQRLPPLVLPPQCPWHEFFTVREAHSPTRRSVAYAHNTEYDDAMTTAYRCFCDDLGVPFRASVATRLRECLASASVDVQYCLSAVSLPTLQSVVPARYDGVSRGGLSADVFASLAHWVGFDGFSASALQAKEVHAIARTLAHCHCFEDIVVSDFSVSEVAMQSLFQALLVSPEPTSPCVAVKGLTLTNVGLTTSSLRTLQHIVLQSTIRRSTAQAIEPPLALQLRRLDLSFNAFSSMMALGLATILEILPAGLEALQLEQCRLSMVSSARILSAMKSSHGFSSGLRDLNLSGNTLGVDGTRTLAMWITGAFALYRLDLSRTRLQTNAFFQAFKQNSILHESSLRAIDLSYNRMGDGASVDLGDILGKTQSLSTLVLRGMKQTRLHPRRVLGDLLHNSTGKKKLKAEGRRTTYGLRTLHLKNILGPMLQNSARSCPCLIDLSENDFHGAKAAALAQLIDSAPNASLASLRLDDAALSDKTAVLLLHSLRACKTLASLSLEGNGFVRRSSTTSYKTFHNAAATKLGETPSHPHRSTAIERAAADALSLLLGAKPATNTTTNQNANGDASDKDSAHSFTHLYQHRAKHVPLRELSLKASGRTVFGEFLITTAVHALAGNATLQMLDVTGNECGDALAVALGTMLPVNKTLQVLYWDDNFTTVDGFAAFYEGLLRNQTLSVVQLPINDTRRILEEQKDPPREKLFSVLGKIFKVTERNQTLASAVRDHHKHPPIEKTTKTAKSPRRKKERQASQSDNQSVESKSVSEPEEKQQEVPASALDVEVSVHGSEEAETARIGRSATRSRYPTTIQSWSRDGPSGGDDVRASWDQIGSLASMLA